MITFKLCKQFNSVEITYDKVEEINFQALETLYTHLPEYKDANPIENSMDKPTEKQISLCETLNLNYEGKNRKQVQKLISKALGQNK